MHSVHEGPRKKAERDLAVRELANLEALCVSFRRSFRVFVDLIFVIDFVRRARARRYCLLFAVLVVCFVVVVVVVVCVCVYLAEFFIIF